MNGLDRVAVCLTSQDPADRRRLEAHARRRGFHRFARAGRRGFVVDGLADPVRSQDVGTVAELHRLLAVTPRSAPLLVRWTGDRVIPLENAVAAAGGTVALGVLAGSPEEVPAALGALERGADLVVVPVPDDDALGRLEELVERPRTAPLSWRTAVVERVEPVGLGDRVLVDTTRLLGPEDALLVGSAAHFLVAVASEATGSAFSRPRAFRVNAGAPHSYVLLADGSTRYLAELEAGDRVLVVRPGSPGESARVGRLKIERRPMVLVELRVGARRPTIFLQEAETVRLLGTTRLVPVTELARGARVRGVALPAARHLGQIVRERVEER